MRLKKHWEANNEDDARKFRRREEVALTATSNLNYRESYNLSQSNATRMREMHDKLVADIGELESRKTV